MTIGLEKIVFQCDNLEITLKTVAKGKYPLFFVGAKVVSSNGLRYEGFLVYDAAKFKFNTSLSDLLNPRENRKNKQRYNEYITLLSDVYAGLVNSGAIKLHEKK